MQGVFLKLKVVLGPVVSAWAGSSLAAAVKGRGGAVPEQRARGSSAHPYINETRTSPHEVHLHPTPGEVGP